MTRYPINEQGQPYGFPDDLVVDKQGYVIGKKPKADSPQTKEKDKK